MAIVFSAELDVPAWEAVDGALPPPAEPPVLEVVLPHAAAIRATAANPAGAHHLARIASLRS
jgi:hypothetical protein